MRQSCGRSNFRQPLSSNEGASAPAASPRTKRQSASKESSLRGADPARAALAGAVLASPARARLLAPARSAVRRSIGNGNACLTWLITACSSRADAIVQPDTPRENIIDLSVDINVNQLEKKRSAKLCHAESTSACGSMSHCISSPCQNASNSSAAASVLAFQANTCARLDLARCDRIRK